MAKTKLFQLYDLKAGLIAGPIMAERNAGPAIRAFHGLLGTKDTTPNQYPDDFNLIIVGEQDDETGELTARTPEIVATGSAWREQQETGASALNGESVQRSAPVISRDPRFITVPEYGKPQPEGR